MPLAVSKGWAVLACPVAFPATELDEDGCETGGVKEITTVCEPVVSGLPPEFVVWEAGKELETIGLPTRELVLGC